MQTEIFFCCGVNRGIARKPRDAGGSMFLLAKQSHFMLPNINIAKYQAGNSDSFIFLATSYTGQTANCCQFVPPRTFSTDICARICRLQLAVRTRLESRSSHDRTDLLGYRSPCAGLGAGNVQLHGRLRHRSHALGVAPPDTAAGAANS